jgi:Thioredoxin like C-terminal domain
VAGSDHGADPGVRRTSPARGPGGDRVRRTRTGRGAAARVGAARARRAQRRRARPAELGGAVQIGRAGSRPDHRRDARESAGVARAAARADRTWTCINWLRQEPYVRAWSQAYRGDGLVVIGVHTPEFSFEHEIDGVRQATKERAIDYPVAVDNDYEVWNAFANRAWPALYLVDTGGRIRDRHFGEGRYEKSERLIQKLLGVERERVSVEGAGDEAEADWGNLRTPETYLGYWRSEHFASPEGAAYDERRTYALPETLRVNHWALAGDWTIAAENALLESSGGTVAFRFHARDAHLVLNRGAQEPIPFRVLLDDAPPGASRGVDVDEAGNGLLDDGRMYQLVRQHDTVRERTLEITFLEPNAEAYSFTFG